MPTLASSRMGVAQLTAAWHIREIMACHHDGGPPEACSECIERLRGKFEQQYDNGRIYGRLDVLRHVHDEKERARLRGLANGG